MLKLIENAYSPIEIGGEQGSLAVPETVPFQPADFTIHPLLNGEVVLALPASPVSETAEAICHVFTRQVWQRGPELQACKDSPSGVVWYHHTTLKLSVKSKPEPGWSEERKNLTVAFGGTLGAVTTVTDEWTTVTRPA